MTDDSYEGQTLGHWKIARLLGAGGMGDVYLANRADGIVKQIAAVKIQRTASDVNGQEAEFLRNLQHRNIARRFEDGKTPDGREYIVMEYVDGPSITDYADLKGLSIPDRLRLFLEVCEAIEFVHGHTVLHLDLKPSNLLVHSDGVPKVIDFGIARRAGEQFGAVGKDAFSRPYASPEQIQGGSKVGYASDIYSTGAVLYELLCGHPPFDPNDSQGDTDGQVLEDIPLLPSQALMRTKQVATTAGMRKEIDPNRLASMRGGCELWEVRKLLSGDLDKICLFALRKEPGRRYNSMADLIVDLQEVLDGNRPKHARSGDPLYSAFNAARKAPFIPLAAALVISAALAISLYPRMFRLAESESRDRTAAIDQATDEALGAVQTRLRPQLAADPRAKAPLSMLDAALHAGARSAPIGTAWDDVRNRWDKLRGFLGHYTRSSP